LGLGCSGLFTLSNPFTPNRFLGKTRKKEYNLNLAPEIKKCLKNHLEPLLIKAPNKILYLTGGYPDG
jgi:hypothetical protein